MEPCIDITIKYRRKVEACIHLSRKSELIIKQKNETCKSNNKII